MNIKIPEYALRALRVLESAGFSAYFVGGCVRDSLLGTPPADWDIATDALPEQVKAAFRGYTVVDTGLKHGTVTVVSDYHNLEITTYRIDGDYSDARRPDSVIFTTDLHEDLKRRDFTVNAMAYHPEQGLVDDWGGKRDLKDKVLRCVGDPEQRFKEDALRILRALRFGAVLGFTIEPKTEAALRQKRALLMNISGERIREELVKLLCGKNVQQILLTYRSILGEVLPEIRPAFDFDQKNPHHYLTVWEHTVQAIANSIPSIRVRFTLLFHDLGKPASFSLDEKGIGHFYGHPELSEQAAREIMHRLHFDNATIDRVTALVRYHDCEIAPQSKSVKRWLNRLGEEGFRELLAVKAADRSATTHKYENLSVIQLTENILDEVIAQKQCFTREQLNINGSDLMDLGIPQGKEIGRILDELLSLVIDEKLPNQPALLKKRAAALWRG